MMVRRWPGCIVTEAGCLNISHFIRVDKTCWILNQYDTDQSVCCDHTVFLSQRGSSCQQPATVLQRTWLMGKLMCCKRHWLSLIWFVFFIYLSINRSLSLYKIKHMRHQGLSFWSDKKCMLIVITLYLKIYSHSIMTNKETTFIFLQIR